MPNWCQNFVDITVWGKDDEEIAREIFDLFYDNSNGEDEVTFEKVYPTPDDLSSKQEYDWHINHWGTKWDAASSHIELDGGYVEMRIETAWSPPEGVYWAFMKWLKDNGYEDNVDVEWFYKERGMRLSGWCGDNTIAEDYGIVYDAHNWGASIPEEQDKITKEMSHQDMEK